MKNQSAPKNTVTDAHSSDQPGDRIGIKDVTNHAVGFALVKSALGPTGDHTARILPSMLQQ